MIALLAALPLLVPSATPPQDPADDVQQVPPIQDAGEYYVIDFSEREEGDGMTLLEFTKACEEATGRQFTFDDATRQSLEQARARLYGTKQIPKADFYRFFQIMMFINEFVCIEVGPAHLSIVVIQSISGPNQARANLRQRSQYVLPEELDLYADQPAVPIITVLHLPNTDVARLSTSLRGLLPNQELSNIFNAGNTNSVILTGFGSTVASLAKLLQIIDEASAITEDVQPVFKLVPLEFAAAEVVADIVEQLMEANRQIVQRQAQARGPEQGVSGALRRGEGEARILVDGRTNSLIIMAMPEDMPQILDLVARLDVDVVEPERNYHVYALENVTAEEIAEVLDEFLQDARTITDESGAAGGRAATQGAAPTASRNQNDVVVVPDPATNSLLIAANKNRYEEVVDLVRQLDRRQDQVLIETALIELTSSDVLDIGVELGLAQVPGVDEETGFGVTSFGLSTLEDLRDEDGNLNPDGVVDTRTPDFENLAGITAGILSGDDFALPILINLIQQRDDTNVLNVPSVLVNNNGHATVLTKDEQPFQTVTQSVNVGTSEGFGGFEEAGITLEISPSISASRYLRLNISLIVANFRGSGTSTSPPPRTTRELHTTVNVPDGDTMVIGGIIVDDHTSTEREVPWLGQIPLIGKLFSRDTSTNRRTTLYFFVTPHILRDREFADLREISYQRKLDAAREIGADRVKVIDPDFVETGEDVRLDGFAVPLYRPPTAGEVDPEDVGIDPIRRNELLRQAAEPPIPGEPSEPPLPAGEGGAPAEPGGPAAEPGEPPAEDEAPTAEEGGEPPAEPDDQP